MHFRLIEKEPPTGAPFAQVKRAPDLHAESGCRASVGRRGSGVSSKLTADDLSNEVFRDCKELLVNVPSPRSRHASILARPATSRQSGRSTARHGNGCYGLPSEEIALPFGTVLIN